MSDPTPPEPQTAEEHATDEADMEVRSEGANEPIVDDRANLRAEDVDDEAERAAMREKLESERGDDA